MPFKIKYKFKEDEKYYSCIVTLEQYRNFQKLPVIQECDIIKKDQKNIEDYKKEMQKALQLAFKHDTSHIRKLSEIIP